MKRHVDYVYSQIPPRSKSDNQNLCEDFQNNIPSRDSRRVIQFGCFTFIFEKQDNMKPFHNQESNWLLGDRKFCWLERLSRGKSFTSCRWRVRGAWRWRPRCILTSSTPMLKDPNSHRCREKRKWWQQLQLGVIIAEMQWTWVWSYSCSAFWWFSFCVHCSNSLSVHVYFQVFIKHTWTPFAHLCVKYHAPTTCGSGNLNSQTANYCNILVLWIALKKFLGYLCSTLVL